MKKWPEIWLGMACVAAVFLVGLVGFAPGKNQPKPENTEPKTQLYWVQNEKKAAASGSSADKSVPFGIFLPETLKVMFGDEVREMPLEEYVYGVVAAEMPAAFPNAALEAQAVAARTYALYQRSAGKHADMGGDVCGESVCCQAFITQAELDERWGSDGAFYTQKVRGAVSATHGMVLTYGGELAAAVYHASSHGQTHSAAEVWGGSQPYLVAVDTPEDTGAKGHGVGMSQRGAQVLGLDGYSCREILAHYYPGTELTGTN